MRAEIKYISMVGGEISEYWPSDTRDFCLGVDATIGLEGVEGGDIFSFEVCSPRWLERNRGGKAAFIRHALMMGEYDERAIRRAVSELVAGISGETWSEIAEKLARYMFWEFEDYEPASGS